MRESHVYFQKITILGVIEGYLIAQSHGNVNFSLLKIYVFNYLSFTGPSILWSFILGPYCVNYFVLEVHSWIGLKSICLRLVSFIAPLGKQVVEPVGEVEDGEEEGEDEPAYHVDSLRSAEIHLIRNAKVT